ncbi:acyl carrier protein [Fertoebacter nigrum]|uniref:Acyl carrier protein n=2 Tax=Fertoeibacter niger TaxID=2656921 RepID=A0A8X8H113_9RHOB|nr:acyl carrier protein [Fertoeibacter niger]
MLLTTAALIAFLTDSLNIDAPVDADTELFSTGLLDSVAMMSIIAFVEEQAKIDVRPADVTLENFDTVGRIADYALANA